MNSKLLFAILVLASFTSCEFLQKKLCGTASGVVMDTIVDYHSVDAYPSFSVCDSLVNAAAKNRCFTNNLYTHLSSSLMAYTFTVSERIDEKVAVTLKIDAKGKATLVTIVSSEQVKEELPQLDSLIKASVQTLPQMFPALKHGIPVATEYVVPLVLKVE